MADDSVVPEIDVFNLPVFADANIFPMIPPDELAELADDIKEHGLNEPVVVCWVNGEWTLVDGRNRLAACRMAEVTPTFRIIEAKPDKLKSLVWSWNGPRRHLTSSQKAMAYAMMYPDGDRGKRNDLSRNRDKSEVLSKTEKNNIVYARFILKNAPEKAELVRDGHPDYPLSKTYDAVKEAAEQRKQQAEAERQKLEQLAALRVDYPDLASLVDEGRIYLDEAIENAANRDRKAAEAERMAQEAEEARLAEAERLALEKKRQEDADAAFHQTSIFKLLHYLLCSAGLMDSPHAMKAQEPFMGTWSQFSAIYIYDWKEAKARLDRMAKNFPDFIKLVEKMRDE
jgi:hypothetical protein